jgi:hypothetical protein
VSTTYKIGFGPEQQRSGMALGMYTRDMEARLELALEAGKHP